MKFFGYFMHSPNYRKFLAVLSIALLILLGLNISLLIFEHDYPGGNIHSLGEAFWFSLVTLTTVGYGDYTPVSGGGRIVGGIMVGLSLSIFGLLIGQITNIMATIRDNKKLGYHGTGFSDHAVVIGWDHFGKSVVDQLMGVGKNVAIITDNQNDVDLIRKNYSKKNVYILFSEYTNFSLVRKSNIQQSSNVFVNLPNDTDKLVYILNLRKHFGDLKIIVTLDNSDLKNTFHSAGTTYTISKNEISSKLVASYIFEPDVAEYSEDIISFTENDDDHDIKEYIILDSNPYCGKDYSHAFMNLKQNCNSILIGISKKEGDQMVLYKNPSNSIKIQEGDYLIMITSNRSQTILNKIFQTEEGVIR